MSKTRSLVECSHYAVARNDKWTKHRIMGAYGSLMHMSSKNKSKKGVAKKRLTNTASKLASYKAVSRQTSQSAYAYPCPLLKMFTIDKWTSVLDTEAMEEGGLVR